MSADTRTEDELRAAVDAGKVAEKELSRRAHEQAVAVVERVSCLFAGDSSAAFEPDELRYAAHVRCSCGAGMAYPLEIGPRGAWSCSAILRGTASREVAHTEPRPFALYEIKSEGQPSASGATTREPASKGGE